VLTICVILYPGFDAEIVVSRVVFLCCYIPLAIIAGGVASPWTVTMMILGLAQGWAGAFFALFPIFSSVAIVVLAYLRGKKIGYPALIWFPVAACILSISPMLFGLVGKWLVGVGVDLKSPAGTYVFMLLATVSTVGPLILHTICCVLGGRRDMGC
jgi:hypothetical protein